MAAGMALGLGSSVDGEGEAEGEAVEGAAEWGSGPRDNASRANSGLEGSTMPQELQTWGSRSLPSCSPHCSGKE